MAAVRFWLPEHSSSMKPTILISILCAALLLLATGCVSSPQATVINPGSGRGEGVEIIRKDGVTWIRWKQTQLHMESPTNSQPVARRPELPASPTNSPQGPNRFHTNFMLSLEAPHPFPFFHQ